MPTFTVSSRFDAHNAAHLVRATLIVSVCAQANKLCFPDVPHLHIDMPQYAGPKNTLDAVKKLIDIGTSLKENDVVLVHCGQGICRSPAAEILLHLSWIRRTGEPITPAIVRNVFSQLKAQRPNARPDKMMLILGDNELQLDGQLLENMT